VDIKLTEQDQELVESLIAQGRFASASDAVSASLTLLQDEPAWRSYAQQRIDAGVRAAQSDDFATDEEVDGLFAKYQRKSA
jgi:putative addiction module CopG family antidote